MSPTHAPVGRARIVVITGEPGSGKTTLGRALSDALRVPFLARDDVRGGLFFTAGAWSEQPRSVPTSEDAVEAFLAIATTAAGLGVSCVVEYVVRNNRPQDLERLAAAADCAVVSTWCRDPAERFATRNDADRLLNRPPVLAALGYATIDQHTRDASTRMRSIADGMRVEFDLPFLRVNTDDGFTPTLEQIIDFVTRPIPSPTTTADG